MTISTNVKAVQIYRRGAMVERYGKVQLQAGTNNVHISGITPGTDTDTIRYFFPEGITGNNIRIIDPSSQKNEEKKPSESTSEKIRELESEIETLKDQMEFWKENAHFQKSVSISIPDMENYIEKMPGRLRDIRSSIRSLQKQKKDLEKTLSDQLEEENKPYISIDLYTDTAGTFPFTIKYYEKAAFWTPVYEIHSEGSGSSLELRIRAKIIEKTKEDWNDVNVTLYTGNPSVSGDLPKITPVYISYAPDYPTHSRVMGYAPPSPGITGGLFKAQKETVYEDAEDIALPDMATEGFMRIETDQADVSMGDTMTEYVLSTKKNLLSGAEGTLVDLQKHTLDAVYRLSAYPKKESSAYLTAEIKTADLPAAVGGTASVYLKGMFTGNTTLDPEMTEDTFLISFGKDEMVSVKRKTLKQKKTSNMLKTQQIREHEYEIILSSSHEEPMDVRVYDQVPVSRDKTITVEILETGKAVHDQPTGKLQWDLTLQPKQTVTIPLSYKVLWAKDKQIRETS